MELKINGPQTFQVNAHSFIASPSETDYVFMYSADGENWSEYDEVTPAGEVLNVFGLAFGTYCSLDGAEGEITIRY